MNKEEREEFEEMKAFIQSLKSSTTIPFEFDRALRDRFRDILGASLSASKLASSEDQAVNEAGSNTYNVLKSPDGFTQHVIGGTTVFLPYYT